MLLLTSALRLETANQPKERSVCKVCLEHHIQLTPACAIEKKLMIHGKFIPDDHRPKFLDLEFLIPVPPPPGPCTQRESLVFTLITELTEKTELPQPPKWKQKTDFSAIRTKQSPDYGPPIPAF